MAKKTPNKSAAIISRRLTKPGGFNIPGVGKVNEGDIITDDIKKAFEDWQEKCQSTIKITDYTQ